MLAFGPLVACGAGVTVARRAGRPAYTTFVYLEDDLHLQWHSLEAWARATPALEPLGFLYGFYRTENSPETGQLMSLDAASRADMRTYNRTVHVPRVGSFIQLPQPYFGLWLATHSQLLHFMRSGFWRKEDALSSKVTSVGPLERANMMIQFVDVPPGFLSRSVVPYDAETNTLLTVAGVPHLRNNYAHSNIHSVIPVNEVLT